MSQNPRQPESAELRPLVEVLDERIPSEGAWVQLTQYGGGPDEGQIVGNRAGYQRFGVEFLKATLDDQTNAAFFVDLEYLVLDDSTINFDWFELSDADRDFPRRMPSTSSWSNFLWMFGCLATFAMIAMTSVVGMVTIVRWIDS